MHTFHRTGDSSCAPAQRARKFGCVASTVAVAGRPRWQVRAEQTARALASAGVPSDCERDCSFSTLRYRARMFIHHVTCVVYTVHAPMRAVWNFHIRSHARMRMHCACNIMWNFHIHSHARMCVCVCACGIFSYSSAYSMRVRKRENAMLNAVCMCMARTRARCAAKNQLSWPISAECSAACTFFCALFSCVESNTYTYTRTLCAQCI